jgi:hypothetical protein
MENSMDSIGVDPDFGAVKPENWRDQPDPPQSDWDDDEDGPIAPDVEMILGFDPDKGWE